MNGAIIVAAGSSRRMGFNKLLAPLSGRPVLWRTLQAFQSCEAIDAIILVAGDAVMDAASLWQKEGSFTKLHAIVEGGSERHFSVWNGLQACPEGTKYIAVHDGARPLISAGQICRCFDAAKTYQAVACARAMTETLKRTDAEGRITASVDRAGMWVMETPQVFHEPLLRKAYESVLQKGALVTDEVSALQHLGHEVRVVENPEPNPKITFPGDLAFAERWLGVGAS